MNDRFDIIIAGAGVVGASTALALAQQGWRVALLDARAQAANWHAEQYDQRVVALTLASQRFLQQLGVWDGVVLRRISPYTHMTVWDGQGTGRVEFDAADVAQDNLGAIVELSALESSLNSRVQSHKLLTVLRGARAEQFVAASDHVTVTLSSGSILTAALLIAADGAQSHLRDLAHIVVKEQDYQHHALVAQLQCERPHQQTAFQRFTESGPLAFLPLHDGHQCSIVWSQSPTQTAAIMQLADREFERELATAFEHTLGAVRLCSERAVFPLKERHAEHYVSERFVLLGDAAHTMHPLAGQGLNLSMADVVEFCAVAEQARKRQLDIGQARTWRPFERRRRGENSAMLLSVAALKSLFERDDSMSVMARNWGLTFVNSCAPVRRFFIGQAMGLYKRS